MVEDVTPATDLWVMTVGAGVTPHRDVPLDGTVRIAFNVSGLLSSGLSPTFSGLENVLQSFAHLLQTVGHV